MYEQSLDRIKYMIIIRRCALYFRFNTFSYQNVFPSNYNLDVGKLLTCKHVN